MTTPSPRWSRTPPPSLRRLPAPRHRRVPTNDRFRTRLPGGATWQQPSARHAGRLPIGVRLALWAALLALAAAVIYVGSGYLRPVTDRVGDMMSAFVGGVTILVGSPTPSPTAAAQQPPRLDPPDRPVTSKDSVDIVGHVPDEDVAQSGLRVRVYVGGEIVAEQPLTGTVDFRVAGVPLASGVNSITATVVGPTGETPHSEPITVTLDTAPPALRVATPKDGTVVGSDRVRVAGKTQQGATVTVRNATTSIAATATASDGSFAVEITLANGPNALVVTSTDQAGNTTSANIDVTRGRNTARAKLSISPQRLRISQLPKPLTVTVSVTDTSGRAINGAVANFSLSLPGLPTTTYDASTARGLATWKTTVPKSGIVAGTALVTVLVTLPDGTALRESMSFPIS